MYRKLKLFLNFKKFNQYQTSLTRDKTEHVV
jgi:hypothetical protein